MNAPEGVMAKVGMRQGTTESRSGVGKNDNLDV
jgi:hypothetical protein